MASYFIGREHELSQFRAALDNFGEDTPHIVFIYDAAEKDNEKGGIGKSRLLYRFKDIAQELQYQRKFLVIDDVFDFYEPVNRDRLSRVSRLAKLLEEKASTKAFDKFWKNIREYYARNVSIEKVMQEYFAGYNQYCQEIGRKIIRFFDTFEAAEKTINYLQEPYRFIAPEILENSFVVISGRNKPDMKAPIWDGLESRIISLPLQGFTDKEARNYFVGAGFGHLDPQDILALNRKAKGRPILLALIVDYLTNKALDAEDILKLDEENFRKHLVTFIQDFRTPPLGQAILAMAHLKHWCNEKFLRQFIDFDTDFDRTYKALKALSFVRTLGGAEGEYVVLHDEMQKMVSKFVLNDAVLRRKISEKAILFYENEIERLRNEEREFDKKNDIAGKQVVRDERYILKAEQWYHKLFVNLADNLNYYLFDLYDRSMEQGRLDYCFVLQSHLDDLQELLELPRYATNRLELRAARLHTEKYQVTINQYYYDVAKKLFEVLIEDAKTRPEEKLYLGVLYCDYGTLQFYARQLAQAEKTLRDSVAELEKIEKIDQDLYYFFGKSKNWLGYILYTQGRFKESIKVLEEAEQHLLKAGELLKSVSGLAEALKQLRRQQIDGWLAQVRGNLCRIYREVGAADKSIVYGESSLHRRRKLGNPKEIIKGLNSLALIYSRTGDVDKAYKLLQEAEDLLQNVPDPILEGRILTNKATLLFKRDQFSDLLARRTRETLSAAKQTLVVEVAKRQEARRFLRQVVHRLLRTNSREQATAYHNLGELSLMEEDYEPATDSFQEAVRIARIENDSYTLLNSLQRLVLTAYLKNDARLFEGFVTSFLQARQELKDPEETARYIIRYQITFGNFYYDKLLNAPSSSDFNENFAIAFQSFTDAIIYARSYMEGSIKLAREVFTDRLVEFQRRVGDVPDGLRGQLTEIWRKEQLDMAELQRTLNL